MKELETIEMFISEDEDSGISAISFVERPAIQENFIALSEHKVELTTMDEDKRIVIGLALVPNKKILRSNRGYEYNIEFSEETVRKASMKYLKTLKLHNATEDHKEGFIEGVHLCETWIVEDSLKDKTALYGLNAPVGSWAVSLKVNDDALWKKIKNGEYLGFSIEGTFKGERQDFAAMDKIEALLDEYKKQKQNE